MAAWLLGFAMGAVGGVGWGLMLDGAALRWLKRRFGPHSITVIASNASATPIQVAEDWRYTYVRDGWGTRGGGEPS